MQELLAHVRELADELEGFPIGKCSPSDDPDKQTAYLYAFRELATRFVTAARRLGDDVLNEMIAGIDVKPEVIQDAYTLRSELLGVIDALRDLDEGELNKRRLMLRKPFFDEQILSELKATRLPNFDVKKLVRLCDELNDCYTRGNYIACLLLIRAVMNHVPPIFGVRTFAEVVAQSGRSAKKILEFLEDSARPLSDFHSHMLIRHNEILPSRGQVEPYRGSFEILISEVIARGETS